MELAKITPTGQLTLPIAIRKRLNLVEGGRIAFIEKDDLCVVANPTMLALFEAQADFEGEAQRLGLKDMDDVVAMIKEVREQRRLENENNP